jgi:hypothetical protein
MSPRGRAIHLTGVATADVALARTPVRATMSGSDQLALDQLKGGDVTNFDACISHSHTQEAIAAGIAVGGPKLRKPLACAGAAHLSR